MKKETDKVAVKKPTTVKKEVVVKDPSSPTEENYELVANINHEASSSHFKVIKNSETGHYMMLAKGMDLPGRDEGAGKLGAIDDLAQRDLADAFGCITNQVMAAEMLYLVLLENPDVKSIEVVGYSIGTIPANYLASVYDAEVTNIADLGVPNTGYDQKVQNWLSKQFDTCANGLFPGVHGEFEKNLNENVVGLKMRADVMGGALGGVGKEYGEQIVLDKGDLNWAGAAHVPEVYAKAATENFPETPQVETTQQLQTDTWKPLN